MKFSCIMATFNDGLLIRQSIASVLNQSFTDFELLVVDDGSQTETKSILAEFDDPRLIVLPQSNDGVSSARNRALHHARGDYICFLDADDTRGLWAFAEVAAVIDEKSPDVVMVGGVLSEQRSTLGSFFDDSQIQGYRNAVAGGVEDNVFMRKAWASSMEAQPANKYISRALVERSALRFPNDHFFEDFFFHCMAIAHAQSVEILDATHYTYFQRALRPQTTGAKNQIRFDILGASRVLLQLFELHPDFENGPQRGTVFLGAMRLIRWCEDCIADYHTYAYRLALKDILRSIDPAYFHIPENTPDPKNEKDGLLAYAQEVLK